jgi:hypothetical protein
MVVTARDALHAHDTNQIGFEGSLILKTRRAPCTCIIGSTLMLIGSTTINEMHAINEMHVISHASITLIGFRAAKKLGPSFSCKRCLSAAACALAAFMARIAFLGCRPAQPQHTGHAQALT